ncbi:hypothetical protein GC169_12965 [bacterium]|nr:hypothetical protein [bacterium]
MRTIRLLGAACAVLVAVLGAGETADAQARPFERDDYATYFAPGRFLTESTYHESRGVLDIRSRRTFEMMGRTTVVQSVSSLSVSRNYDVLSAFPYYKIKSEGAESMLWDPNNRGFLFEFTDGDFDQSDAIAWESMNADLAIVDGDQKIGLLTEFYRNADARARQDVNDLEEKYRHDVVGAWLMQCFFIEQARYDVECSNVHLPTGRVERHFYKKFDLLS